MAASWLRRPPIEEELRWEQEGTAPIEAMAAAVKEEQAAAEEEHNATVDIVGIEILITRIPSSSACLRSLARQPPRVLPAPRPHL